MHLYEITDKLAVIENTLAENGGELTPDLESILDSVELDFTAKVENIGKMIRNLDGDALSLTTEIERLTKRKKAAEALQERLKNYVKLNMEKVNKSKVEFAGMTFTIQKNPASLEIDDEFAIPARFVTVIPEKKITDKKAVLDALKNGEEIPGARLITDRTHIRLR